MFLNVEQLEKQLDKEDFQEIGSMAAFNTIPEFHDTLIQHLESVKKSTDERAQLKREYDSWMNERQTQTTEEKVDTNIRPIYDEEPMAKVQTTAEINVFARGQQHTEQPKFNNEGEVDQNAEECHDTCPLPAILTDKQIPEHSFGLRWVPTGKIFASSTTKVDSEPLNGSADITNQYECEQTLDVSAGLELFLQDIQSFELKVKDSVRINLRYDGDECDKGRMSTKIELTLEQSQQGDSNDVLVSIEGDEELERNKMAPKQTTRSTPVTTTTTFVIDAQLKALTDQGVANALAARDTDRSRNGEDSHDLGMGVRRQAPPAREMETLFRISNRTVENQIKFSTCTLLGSALTWWNSHVMTVGPDVAYAMTSTNLRKKITDKYCLGGEIKKLEGELWNLRVKSNDVVGYTQRFQELALLYVRMFPEESDKVERYVGGLPDVIHGIVVASRPKTMQDAIEMATGNGYSRKRQKQSQKRQNQARNGKDQKRQSHSKSTKVNLGKVKVKPDKAEAEMSRKMKKKGQYCHVPKFYKDGG
nr:hypothetical protein [Tanacetum cinerariifolium]